VAHFSFRRGANSDNRNTAQQLGQAFLQFLAIIFACYLRHFTPQWLNTVIDLLP
jgi:hypothetical protein